ncbi:MAG: hypothetical protein ACRDGJ_06210 [Candidatus Limnocylindria bacterium]
MADTIGEVLVTDLVVRSAPGVGADSEILEGRLTLGDTVYVIEGPVQASGYAWFLVAEIAELREAPSLGWIAQASREGEPWVRRTEPPCPDEISVEALASVAESLRLFCFGGQELTLDGEIQPFCGQTDPVIQDPSWLGNYGCAFSAPDRPDAVSDWPAISVHFDPQRMGGGPPFTGPAQIVGRHDAPVAQACHYSESSQGVANLTELDQRMLVFRCRASFVVESATPLAP